MRARTLSICEECNYRSYAPPPITGNDSLLAFPSKLKALLVFVAVHTVEVVPDKGFKGSLLLDREKHKQLSRLQIVKGGQMWTQRECFFLAVLAIWFKSQSSILRSSLATVPIQCEWQTIQTTPTSRDR